MEAEMTSLTQDTQFEIEFDREEDGHWIAEVRGLPGVVRYGVSREQAQDRVEALARQVVLSQSTKV